MSIMRDFFRRELEDLETKTGYKQYTNLTARPNWQDELKKLLDLLEVEANKHPFDIIGIDIRQRIIQEAIVSAKDFIGLNPRFIHQALRKWWDDNKNNYLEKKTHDLAEEVKKNWQPLEGEARKKAIEEWERVINQFNDTVKVRPLTQKEIEVEGQTDPKKEVVLSASKEYVIEHKLKLEWARLYHTPETGNRKPDWIPFEEWLKTKTTTNE